MDCLGDVIFVHPPFIALKTLELEKEMEQWMKKYITIDWCACKGHKRLFINGANLYRDPYIYYLTLAKM